MPHEPRPSGRYYEQRVPLLSQGTSSRMSRLRIRRLRMRSSSRTTHPRRGGLSAAPSI